MDAFLREAGSSRRAGEGYYLRGLARLKLKDPTGAKADFTEACQRCDEANIQANSLNALGDIAWDEDDMDEAGRYFARALEHTERGKKPADHSHYRLGCVLQRQGKWQEADVQFSRLDYLFRDGELAQRAARRINCRAWTVQAGAFHEKARADLAAEKLRDAKLPATVEARLQRQKLTFFVQVGRYGAYEEAVAALAGVRQHVPDAFVITTR